METGDAAFAPHPETGDLYLRILRRARRPHYAEFEDHRALDRAERADKWDDRLAAGLAGPA
ncbi:MAG: hypothetical protein IPQ07_17565 [Myxococcales bacterium]|nr:hypothetical protein [Myxococcales bacterium]